MNKNQRNGVLTLVAVVAVCGTIAILRNDIAELLSPPVEAPREAKQVLAPLKPAPARFLGESTEAERIKYLDTYGLRPDRRYLRAVQVITTAKSPPEPMASEKGWSVPAAEGEVVTVSSFPNFEELTVSLALISGAKPPVEASQLESPASWLLPPEAALRLVSNADPLKRLRALISLVHEQTDLLGVGDALPAEAWVALVRAESTAGKRLVPERAMLARSLGYTEEAKKLAEELPPDPLALYLRAELLASPTLGSSEQRALAYRTALPRGLSESDKYFRLLKNEEVLTPHAYGSKNFRTAALVTSTCSEATMRDLRKWAGESPVSFALDLSKFGPGGAVLEELRAFLASKTKLPGLPQQYEEFRGGHPEMVASPAAAAFMDSRVASCAAARVRFLVDLLSESDFGNEALLSEFDETKLPMLQDVHRWLSLKLAGAARTTTSDRIAETLNAASSLGGGAAVDGLKAFAAMADFGDRNNRRIALAAIHRLDTRPDYARESAKLLAPQIGAPELHEKWMDHWASAAGNSAPVRLEWWKNRAPRDDETNEAFRIRRQTDELARLRANYAAEPGNWYVMNALSAALRKDARSEAVGLHRKWLQDNPEAQDFTGAMSQEELLDEALDRGALSDARPWAEKLGASFRQSSINAAFRYAMATEDWTTAEALVQRSLGRYEHSRNAIKTAFTFYFEKNRLDEVLALIDERKELFTITFLAEDIGPLFARAFHKRPVSETEAALVRFQRAKLDTEGLAGFARAFAQKEAFEHAVAVHFAIQAPSPVFALFHRIRAYPYMVKWKSEEEALAWIKKTVPSRADGVNTMLAFSSDQMQLSYVLDEGLAAQQGKEPDYIWLMRGADELRKTGKITESVRARLAAGGDNLNGKMARYLIGALDEKMLLKEVKEPFDAGEVAYVLALRAQVESRPGDALLWFRASKEAGNLFSNGTRESIDQVHLINERYDYRVD